PASSSEDAAVKTGLSQRTVQQSIRRATKIDAKVRDKVRTMPDIADSRVELDALGDLDPERQRHALTLVQSGKAKSVRDAKRQMVPKVPSKEEQLRAMRDRTAVASTAVVTASDEARLQNAILNAHLA